MMDASASQKSQNPNQLYGFFLLQEPSFPSPVKSKNTVIKYTKLPGFDFDSQVSWPQQAYTLQPRLRRIISLDDESDFKSSRSLATEYMSTQKILNSNNTKRKIVTISEDDENDLHPRFSKDFTRRTNVKTSNRSVETRREDISRLSSPTKSTKEVKSSAKMNNVYNINKKELGIPKLTHKGKSNISNISMESNRVRNMKEKETIRTTKSANAPNKISLSKKLLSPSESDKELNIKSKYMEGMRGSITSKKTVERSRPNKSPSQNKTALKEMKNKKSSVTVIHVPLDEKYRKPIVADKALSILCPPEKVTEKRDSSTETEMPTMYRDVNIGTDPYPTVVDQTTEIDHLDFETICKCVENLNTQTEIIQELYESLVVPNVTLIKDNNETKEVAITNNKSLPDLRDEAVASDEANKENLHSDAGHCKSASYIMRRAVLTYTTRQKFDLQLIGKKDKVNSNQLSSPIKYPMNVVSVYKAEKKNDSNGVAKESKVHCDTNEQKSLNCSYVFNRDKLMKPSDIISTITGSASLLHGDYICEQFQKELNFIDSFFESLQYLESCSLSEKCLRDNNVGDFVNDSVFDESNSDYANLLSKLEDGANISDSETMASKNLCVLNLLIRDEQRRATNLLFVLKMREDALKDFTKSQILWLEKKKKQDNTDISTLKKKQRGALLKLQHECGEMQRMRKALIALSEKRKVGLMKTKMNIELKLKNNVDVEQIIMGKKKLKRSALTDRNVAPVKCFDLSSSGCEESATSRSLSEGALLPTLACVTSAEKCIQTGDSILGTVLVDQSTDTAAQNFIVVDGGYLNILFQNLSLPQIFGSSKQYEVNEEALRNIVHSANTNTNLSESDVVGKLMDQIKNCDLDSSSSASTARSLIDEYDQYYRNLDEKSPDIPEKCDENETQKEIETSDVAATLPVMDNVVEVFEEVIVDDVLEVDSVDSTVVTSQVGPLPVPAGATSTPENTTTDVPDPWPEKAPDPPNNSDNASSTALCPVSSVSSLPSPVVSEAEELRRQQLAIEREIKALEQQQCQLLVVREIPDKPPPPYTPPTETKIPKPPKLFQSDEETVLKVHKYMSDSNSDSFDTNDPFDSFLKDYCQETLDKQRSGQSVNPWDACNLLPQKQPVDSEKLKKNISGELKEILSSTPTTVMSGVGSRRSDHVDDILFAEWRRCEPQWTSLHTDEALVKNQLFDSIFQKILTETIDEYKKTVQNCEPI